MRTVDDQVWTFEKEGRRLEIRRSPTTDGVVLGIEGDGQPRSTLFRELDRLTAFQTDFEKFLLATGWTFVGFSPERRVGHERRHYSRLLTDRRRWWTDGPKTAAEREREQRQHDVEEQDRRRRRRGSTGRPR